MKLYNIILMVDDDLEDQEFFTEALHEIDPTVHCVTANNYEHAQSVLAGMSTKPDLIFVDINMPKYNGKQLLIVLKSSISTASIPVVMYSTHFTEADVNEMRTIGAAHFVTKKTTYHQLRETLKDTISINWV